MRGRLTRVQVPSDPPERAADTGTSGGLDAVQRWRLVFRRTALPAESSQRDQLAAWDEGLRATGLPVAGLDGPRPKPRFALAAPLGNGIPGEAELADLWLTERLPRWRVREALAAAVPAGHELVDLYDVWLGEPPVAGRVVASVYRAVLSGTVDPDRLAAAVAGLLAADALPRQRRKGEGMVGYDLRPFLAALDVTPRPGGGAVLRMDLRHDPARGVGRPDEVLAALGDVLGGDPLPHEALVRESLTLAEAPAPEPPAPKGRRRVPTTGSETPGGQPHGQATRRR